MSRPQFLLDENLDPVIQKQLQQQHPEIVVWKIGDPGTPVKGTLDPAILQWCEAKKFSLVTNSRASMPVHLAVPFGGGPSRSGSFCYSS